MMTRYRWDSRPGGARPVRIGSRLRRSFFSNAVSVQVVKYQGMLDKIRSFRGGCWSWTLGGYLPHLQKRISAPGANQRKYATDGVAAISVSLDDPSQRGVNDRVLRFLKAQNAALPELDP